MNVEISKNIIFDKYKANVLYGNEMTAIVIS